MPNWCECDLNIAGPTEDLDRFQAGFVKAGDQDEEVDFNFIVPLPKELEETTSGSFGSVGYDAFYGSDQRVAAILTFPWAVEAKAAKVEQQQATERPKLFD